MTQGFWEQVLQFGMGGVIFVGFLIVLKWVFETMRQMVKDVAEERRLNQEIQQQFAKSIKEHTESARAFHDEVKEAHKFQRDEHKEMIDILGRINGYKKNE